MTTIHRSQRGFIQILPLVLLAVFAVTTVVITNSARNQPGPATRAVTQATGGCTFNGSFFEPGLHCVQNWAYWCYENGNFERGDHSCGSGPAPTSASCGNWNVSCNNGEGFSTNDCVVIRDFFAGDENKWKTEACQYRCGIIGSTNTCGGGTGGGTVDRSATCASSGTTASACYGVAVGAGCTGFNGRCVQNGGTTSDGFAVCGCIANAAPTQRPLATATSQPTVRPQATATTRPTATRIPPSPTTATRDDYFTRLPTATRVPSATPTIRFVERENVYNSPTPGIGSGYRCGNTYRGRCVGQGLVCDRAHFGQIDCPSGNNCVPETAVCRTPAAPSNPPAGGPTTYSVSSPTPIRIGPCTSVNGTRISEPLNGVQYVCCDGSVIRSPCLSSQGTQRQPTSTTRPTTYSVLPSPTSARGTTTGYAAYCSISGSNPGYPACSTCPRIFITISGDLGRCSDPAQPTSTPVPRPTVDLSAVAYCAVGTSSFYRPCSECAGGPSNVEYPFGQTSSLRRCRNGYGSGSTYPIISPTPTVSYDAEDYRTSLRSPTTYQPTNVVPLAYGNLCYAPNDPPIPGLTSCLGCPDGGRYTRLDTTNNPIGTSRCTGPAQPPQVTASTQPDLVQTFERDTTTVGNAVGDAVSSSTRTVTGAITDLTSALSVLSCSVWNSLQVAFGGERVDCNSRFYR